MPDSRKSALRGSLIACAMTFLAVCCGGTSSSPRVTLSADNSTAAIAGSGLGSLTLAADGSATATITVTLRDQAGAPVAGALLTAQSTGKNDTIGVSGPTDSSGNATVTVASLTAQTETISFTAYLGEPPVPTRLTATIALAFVAVENPQTTAITASPAIAPADGATPITVTVTLRDILGQPVAGAPVTFSAPGGAGVVLVPATPVVTDASGQAAVSARSAVAQSGFIISASAAPLPGAGSAPLVLVTPALAFVHGNVTGIVWQTQPSAVAAGDGAGPFIAPPQVAFVDAQGNTVPDEARLIVVDLVQGTTPHSLGFGGTVMAENGVATYRYLSVSRTGTYTLRAQALIDRNLVTALSAPFTVTPGPQSGAPGGLQFGPVPNLVVTPLGTAAAMPVSVSAVDRFGNPAGIAGTTVTLAPAGGNPAALALGGTLTATTDGTGTATFSLATLTASSGTPPALPATLGLVGTSGAGPSLRSVQSPAFFATDTGTSAGPSATSALVPAHSPDSAVSGQAASLEVKELDSLGGGIGGDTVTFAITSAPLSPVTGALGTAAGATTATSDGAGAATFTLTFDVAGTYGVSYSVTSPTLGTTQVNSTVNVSPGPPARLVFQDQGLLGAGTLPNTGQPRNALPGADLGPVTVLTCDAASNLVAGATSNITLALSAPPPGFTLVGAPPAGRAAANGSATFTGLSVATAAALSTTQPLALVASASGLSSGTSAPFLLAVDITQPGVANAPGSASAVRITAPLADPYVSDGSGSAASVALMDGNGHVVTGDSATAVTYAWIKNGVPTGSRAVVADGGIATYSSPFYTGTEVAGFITATSPGLTPDFSRFELEPNLDYQLGVLARPIPGQAQSGTVIGSTPSLPTGGPATGVSPGPYFVLGVEDIDRNPRSASGAAISVMIDPATPGIATLSGTTTVNAVAGVAIFDDLRLTLIAPLVTGEVKLLFHGPSLFPPSPTLPLTITVTQ